MRTTIEQQDAGQGEAPPAWTARWLLRAARQGILATATAGQPFAALVTPATAPDLSVLLLLSELSEHTRHLRADPRCALLVSAPPSGANPQTAARVTVTGLAEPISDAGLKARYLAIHPYAGLYADFGDFALWRLRPAAAMLVGGFARAHRLRADALLAAPASVAAIALVEQAILAHCNQDHAAALGRAAIRAGHRPGDWRMVAADTDGMDLVRADAPDDGSVRIAWPEPVADAGGLRAALMALVARDRPAP
ncbi:MAG: DUF2470 domain-containing protein [Rhodospirillales bacterium]|nr:DUF2470 domain-containing protein [Rhodospirillales bacterium]